jgi:leucyl/phenylalanyl-tRNA--protein transferase
MPVHLLDNRPGFPDPSLAESDGLLAVGGDLSAERLLSAYAGGIFPWYSQGYPILWWSPDPRMILFPGKFRLSKSLRQSLRNKKYSVRFDTVFAEVIAQCSHVPRFGQGGTWITEEMKSAYNWLHQLGYAHSVETFVKGKLVGGLYGVSLGKAFFGESMFHVERDASKIALFYLVKKLTEWDFHFIDAQVETGHLQRLGAENIPRSRFLEMLETALRFPTKKNNW